MPKLPRIRAEDLPQLKHWLDVHGVPTQQLAKDCADAVIVAKLLNDILPISVNLQNFIPINTIEGRLQNWKLLNKKVLTLTGLSLHKNVIKLLAHGYVNGLIESLLFAIKNKTEKLHYKNYSPTKQKYKIFTFSTSHMPRFKNLKTENEEISTEAAETQPMNKHTQSLILRIFLARRIAAVILVFTYLAIVTAGVLCRIYYFK